MENRKIKKGSMIKPIKTATNGRFVKHISRLLVLVMLLVSALSFTSCLNRGIEDGMRFGDYPFHRKPRLDYLCGYKSDTRKFDINDVTLTFYYGFVKTYELPSFKVLFRNDNEDEYFIKEIENDDAEKYYINIQYKDTRFYQYIPYTHSEEITIPKELFVSESGYIMFILASEHVEMNEIDPERLCSVLIFYEKNGNEIILSVNK